MDENTKGKFIYTCNRTLSDIWSMIACIIGSVAIYQVYINQKEFWILVMLIFMIFLSVYVIDDVFTKVKILIDSPYLYFKPNQPLTFKRPRKYRLNNIDKVTVITEKSWSRYGTITSYIVAVRMIDRQKHRIFSLSDKEEAKRIKRFISKYKRYKTKR